MAQVLKARHLWIFLCRRKKLDEQGNAAQGVEVKGVEAVVFPKVAQNNNMTSAFHLLWWQLGNLAACLRELIKLEGSRTVKS